jgi:predicted nuclease with RNAse H fold
MSRAFPYGVYTIPEISMIGATEDELKAQGVPYEAGRSRYENNARGQITGDPDGFIKLLFDPATKKLLGAHLIGGGATELVHIPQMVMAKGGSIDDFIGAVFNFPTLSECFRYAAYDGLQRLANRSARAEGDESSPVGARSPRVRSEAERSARAVPPGGRPWFLGASLSHPAAHASRPVTLAAMDRWRRVRFRTWTYSDTGEGLIAPDLYEDGFVLAIDAPQGMPASGSRTRECLRLLRELGRWDSDLPRDVRGRANALPGSVALFAALRKAGLGVLGEVPHDETTLIEVHPADLWPHWAGRRLPKKTLPAGRRLRYDTLRGLGVELPIGPDAVNHDHLDAAASAFAAYLWATGKAKEYGQAPVYDEEAECLREGRIVSL